MINQSNILQWQHDLYKKYLSFRKKCNNCTPSTEKTVHAAIYSFYEFINMQNVENISDVQSVDLKNWSIHLIHLKTRTRNLYVSQLRIFFEYLAEENIVSGTLPMALMYSHAPITTIVDTLTEEQLDIINDYRINASTAIELRNIAIVLLGLKMGIRSIDIFQLELSDISWKERTISFEQKKTGVFTMLPFSTEVGNSVYRYITEGRPRNSKSNRVFLSHNPPYDGLKHSSIVRNSLKQIFLKENVSVPKGFHITRKTFASNLLCSGNTIDMIATALGHSSLRNIDPYLSTDDKNLRLCGIGCENINYKGVYGL
ncbi:tyrosine-type recombinase/integrase [Ructibacterium gallinarum]|uniref:Tyrosine-type recombinase/integrase n=1 Tax=Ructibacterium gallinarum TaxID=2779355 RepID=A0A9D5M2X8_9FIRM|nr:tyrosine-type recombinase/integrase [Ructibacterium gallinarum]MBE5040538.1 tyrosine-type recombinase/integrase [Ructibacterium gallinarum]